MKRSTCNVSYNFAPKPLFFEKNEIFKQNVPKPIKEVSSSVAHKKGGFLGFFLNMKTATETNDLLRIFEHIFIQQ